MQRTGHQGVSVLPWSMGFCSPWAAGFGALQTVGLLSDRLTLLKTVKAIQPKVVSNCRVNHIGSGLTWF